MQIKMTEKKSSHIEEKNPMITEEMKIALQTAQALTELPQQQQRQIPQTYKCNICRKEFTNYGNTSNMSVNLFMETLSQHIGLHGMYELNFQNVLDHFTVIPS